MKLLQRLLPLVALLLAPLAAAAQSYPSQPVKLLVGFPPGGATDVVGRIVAQALSERFAGSSFVVDNRPGASGVIGVDAVAKAPPDGHTLAFVPSSYPLLRPLLGTLPFDPDKDLAPIGLVGSAPYILVVHPSLPVASLKELLAYARGKPGELAFASTGMGTFQHLGGELMKRSAGIDILHVPYKGSGAVRPDLLSGRIQLMFDNITVIQPLVKSGEMRGLAVTSAQRSPLVPELPTMEEAGLPGFVMEGWFAILAPARTPAPVVKGLNLALNASLKDEGFLARLAQLGAVPRGGTPDDLAVFMRGEAEKWGGLIREAGIKAE